MLGLRKGGFAVLVIALALVGASSGCSGDEPSTSQPEATQQVALPGSYELVGDIGGTQVKSGARVTLTLKPDGSLSLEAVQPGETLVDSGTWKVTGDKMSVAIKELGVSASDRPYSFDGSTLDFADLRRRARFLALAACGRGRGD